MITAHAGKLEQRRHAGTQHALADSLASEAPSLVIKREVAIYICVYYTYVKVKRSTRLRMHRIITWQPMQPV